MLTTFNITQQGEYHIKKGSPCQDYSKTLRIHSAPLACDLIISAVSDGVGSCLYSQDGSREAVETAVGFVIDGLNDEKACKDDTYISDLLHNSFEAAYDAVLKYAEDHEYPFAQLDSTLTVSIYDGSTVWFGHIGDDGIVVIYADGSYEMITDRHKGEFASSVCPLREIKKWQFGKTEKAVASFALMTDGVLDYLVGSEFYDNRIFYPFIQPVLAQAMDSDEKMDQLKAEFETYLKDDPDTPSGFRKLVTDDISIAVVQNSESVSALPEISFDLEQWDRETEEYRRKAYEKLYEKRRKPSKDQNEKAEQRKPLIVDPFEDDKDELDILTSHDSRLNATEADVQNQKDQTEDEINEAAEQVISDFVEMGNTAGKNLRRLVESTRNLTNVIYSSLKDRKKE